MPRPLKQDILSDSTIILSRYIDKYAFMWGSNFYETDVTSGRLVFVRFLEENDDPKKPF